MINQGQPGIEEAKLEAFGFPWHGLFKDGVVQLVNGQYKTFPATKANQQTGLDDPCPVNLGGHRPGDVSTVRIPGHAFTQSAEEVAIDYASGQQWLSYGVISGRDRYMYGSKLGERSWLYCVAPGLVWLVTMAEKPLSGVLNFKIARFGQVGEGADAIVRSVDMPFPSAADLGIHIDRYDLLFTELCGHSEDGKTAAIGLGLTLADASPIDRNSPYPEAFLTVGLSGGTTKENVGISLAIYRTGPQCTTYDIPMDHVAVNTISHPTTTPGLIYTDYEYPTPGNGGSYDSSNYWAKRQFHGFFSPDETPPANYDSAYYSTKLLASSSFDQSRFSRNFGEQSTVTEQKTTRTIWVMVDAGGGLHPVDCELYYKFSQIVIRYENDLIGQDISGYDTNLGYVSPGITRYPNGGFYHSWETFTGGETILTLTLKVDGGAVDTWRAYSKSGTVEKYRTDTVLGTGYNSGVAGDPTTTSSSGPAKVDTIGGRSVQTAVISTKCAPNPQEKIMGYAPNWYLQDETGKYYWPYIYLYSNTLVGIIEGQLPEKVDLGLNGPDVSVYLVTSGDGQVTCRGIYSLSGTINGGVVSAGSRYCSRQPVTGECSVLTSSPAVYI